MAKRRIMGLDASTTTIGVAVIEIEDEPTDIRDQVKQRILGIPKPKLIHYEFYKPAKTGGLFERLDQVRSFITQRVEKFKPDEVALEDIILFMKGHSTAATTSSLAVLNRTVGLAVMNALEGKPPHLFNVMKIRHCLKLTPVLPAKEEMPELVAKHLGIDFPYQHNKNAKIITENYDMADAIAVALVYAKIGPPDAPKKKTRKKKKK